MGTVRDCLFGLMEKKKVPMAVAGNPLPGQLSAGVTYQIADCGKDRMDSEPVKSLFLRKIHQEGPLSPRVCCSKHVLGVCVATALLLVSGFIDSTKFAAANEPFGRTSQSRGDSPVRISVHVYNYGRVPRRLLDRAENVATTIFAKAGIDAAWVDCPPAVAQIKQYPACPSQLGADGYVLNLLPESMAIRAGLKDTTFGFARLSSDDERSYFASVFWDRISQAARGGDISAFQLLGYVMAHEVGHLLLGSTGHAPQGVMIALWSPEKLENMARTLPLFTPKECRDMRVETLARIENRKLMAHAVERSEQNH
jgi:hypothetical protein